MQTPSSLRKFLVYSLLVGLLLTAAGQVFVQRYYIHRWLVDTYRHHELEGMDRSAMFMLDRVGSDFLEFIRVNTPDNGPVIVPQNTPSMLREQSVMQFFLMPRGIPTCSCSTNPADYSETCLTCLREPNHTIPAVGEFPDPGVMEGYKQFVPFPSDSDLYKGLYISLDSIPVTSITAPEPSAGKLAAALLLDMTILFALTLTGALIIRLFHPNLTIPDTWITAFPVGAGLFSWVSFLLGWAGVPVNLYLYAGVWLLITLPALLFNSRRQKLPFPKSIRVPAPVKILSQLQTSPLMTCLLISGAVLILSMFIISAGRAYSLFDGIANWALKGYAIAYQHSVQAGAAWGGHGLSYPQNVHHLIALFKLADNDILPGSKLIFPLFSTTMVLTVYRFWTRNRVPVLVAAAGMVLLLTIPEMYKFSTYGWSNIIFTSYLVSGSIFAAEGASRRSSPDLILGALLLGLAGWTRPEGIGFAAAIIGAASLFIIARSRSIRPAVPGLITALLIPGIWMIFGYSHMSGDEIGGVLSDLLNAIRDGSFRFTALNTLLPLAYERFSSFELWGGVLPLLAAAGPVLLILGYKQRKGLFLPLFVSAVLTFLIPHLMFFAAAFNKPNTYLLFLQVSYDRAMFPGVVLLLASLILLVPEVELTDPAAGIIDRLMHGKKRGSGSQQKPA